MQNNKTLVLFLHSVECLYDNTSHLNVNFTANVIRPGAAAQAVFTFYARETISYEETVSFQLNGLSTHDVSITGEGTELRVSATAQAHLGFHEFHGWWQIKPKTYSITSIKQAIHNVFSFVSNHLKSSARP